MCGHGTEKPTCTNTPAARCSFVYGCICNSLWLVHKMNVCSCLLPYTAQLDASRRASLERRESAHGTQCKCHFHSMTVCCNTLTESQHDGSRGTVWRKDSLSLHCSDEVCLLTYSLFTEIKPYAELTCQTLIL